MTLQVIGAGFGRTGTLSLKVALEKLGFSKCYHMVDVMAHPDHTRIWSDAFHKRGVDWDVLFDGYRAAVDWPACNWWQALADYYPDAKVILSTRDPERWYKSVRDTIYASTRAALASADEPTRARGRWIDELIWQPVFDGRMDDQAHAIGVLKRHEAQVTRSIAKDRLLVFEAVSGWQPLCAFLNVPVPDEPYPRVNTTEEFLARTRPAQSP